MNEPLTISDEAREVALELYKLLGNNVINKTPSYVRDLEPIVQLAINAAVEKATRELTKELNNRDWRRAYADTVAQLTRDNKELGEQLASLRKVADGLAESCNEFAAHGWCDCDIPNGVTCDHCKNAMALTAYTNFINQQKEGK